jgi:preprotein translocase subunit SecE
MGKVRDEAASSKPASAEGKGTGRRAIPAAVGRFFGNLVRADVYKASQGWYARLWTALGLGALVLAGLYTLFLRISDTTSRTVSLAVPTTLAALFGWFIFRLVQYPPFADFLIATEAEMKKISWATWPELKRATLVVVVTVLLMAVYLFGVDLIWQALLKAIGVLRFSSSGFGSQAG